MPQFEFRVVEGGRVSARLVEAPDVHIATSRVGVPIAQILSVEAVRVDEPPHRAFGTAFASASARFPLRLFSQELAVLLGAGIPLLEAIVTLREKEASPRVAQALAAVAELLQQGQPLSAALTARPAEFDALFIAVVSSAERTGQLQTALRAHAAYLGWVDTLRAQLVNASLYPAMLIVAGVSVMLFLLVFVVPRFAGLLDGIGGDMPAASRALIELGRFTGERPLATIAAGLSILVMPWLALRQPALREAATDVLWSLPGLGAKLRVLALARLYRTAGMLLDAGVPVVSALRTSRDVVAPRLRASLDAVVDAVSRGERLSLALERELLTTPVSLRMVRVGERSGELAAMLGQAAAFYDEELSRLSEVVTRLVNPLLMLLMGGLIGTVVVLMYMPIFQLVEQVQ